jgi:GNAT superfamily N-acetyltransferase
VDGDLIKPSIRISDGVEGVNFEVVHEWLTNSYWSPGIAREKVERAARNSSLVVSAHVEGAQAGYLRIVSDKATFAWVCDVFVGDEFRRLGIAKAMLRFAQAHPEHQGLRRWVLATRDAHGVYEECDFILVPNPERWMIYFPG